MGEQRFDLPPFDETGLKPTISPKKTEKTVGAFLQRLFRVSQSDVRTHPPVSRPEIPIHAIPDNDLRDQLKTAKRYERAQVLTTYRQASKDMDQSVLAEIGTLGVHRKFAEKSRLTTSEKTKNVSFFSDITEGSVAHAIMREAKLQGKEIEYSKALDAAQLLIKSIPANGRKINGFTLSRDKAQEIVTTAQNAELSAKKTIATSYGELCSILKELDGLIERSLNMDPSQWPEVNKRILSLIRKAKQSPAYQFLSHDESIPAIAYLHRIVMASFFGPNSLGPISGLGAATLQKAQALVTQEKPEDTISVRGMFSGLLRFLRKSAEDQHLTASDKTAEYVRSNPGVAFSALQSETRLLGRYDPRMAENASGTLFAETVTKNGKQVVLSGVYTPSPTLGDEVSPEAECCLQALENRRCMSQEQLDKEPAYARQTHWSFTSLQNIRSRNEGARARAIMALNQKFPLSFAGITVTQDSEFYVDGVHGSSDKKIRERMIEHGKTPMSQLYKDEMMDQLVLQDGYDFPPGFSSEDIVRVYRPIVNSAYDIVTRHRLPEQNEGETKPDYERRLHLWQWRQKAAFRELVNLGVMRYWQLRSLPAQGGGVITCCCKECIDRGGKVMAELLWALGDGSEDSLKQVFTAVQGRALLARNRIILPARLEPFIALTEFVSQEEANTFLTQKVGVPQKVIQSQKAQPALPAPLVERTR